ncbi:unnamed protein product [Timema podura]|uniref:Uncharacterized protein n=1 Tax=Timema podura TaxID=61482 RepID=A0ABN7PKZ0_TIMPD|nr:unnamed protein product [Timema podura]
MTCNSHCCSVSSLYYFPTTVVPLSLSHIPPWL